jgi:ribosomal-protein-serine acetyltransferase
MFQLVVDHEITVRTLHPDDAETLFKLLERNRARLKPWIHPSALPDTPQSTRKYTIECYFGSMDPLNAIDTPYINEVRPYFPLPNPPMELGIWFRDTLGGLISFEILEDSATAGEFGYWLGEEFEGRGIVTRCVATLMDYAIEHMNIERFVIGCAATNLRSRAVPERLGYRLHATVPHGEVVGAFVYDRVLYEIRSAAWQANRP